MASVEAESQSASNAVDGGAVLPRLVQAEIQRLREFHASHFPGQDAPVIEERILDSEQQRAESIDDVESLGYYNDGVARTLTDEQIRMFRHSEIQRLLMARRQRREKEEQQQEKFRRQQERDRSSRRRFDDDQQQHQPSIDTLIYDDQVDQGSAKTDNAVPRDKTFRWPRLGS
ncbi:uncharacterized protein HMPREF1541_07960 [Cyphellophora europaea CBS 101466]|uniref:Uncharacterized protein n=1 Tax=Cyphellophora europaea (strain CBS 101466) TaxID=1220924 RepID=W2RKG4_CYPE1|nr:uncharacterized protein HMPREF1541_07960 [Cyphellophora europaea CBS 101466]ETN36972.1 hypothetical protein HMPREF1541_07960 [Cyphellophora europaea CBS 101466]